MTSWASSRGSSRRARACARRRRHDTVSPDARSSGVARRRRRPAPPARRRRRRGARMSVELIDELEAGELSVEFEGEEPETVLEWALERFAPRIAISTAFQIDGVAL